MGNPRERCYSVDRSNRYRSASSFANNELQRFQQKRHGPGNPGARRQLALVAPLLKPRPRRAQSDATQVRCKS